MSEPRDGYNQIYIKPQTPKGKIDNYNKAVSILSPHCLLKKGKRKVQGVPQSQTAALSSRQEEEETVKTK